MIRKFARTFKRMAVILIAVGVVTLGVYAVSISPLASSLSEERGGPPAAMMNAEESSTTNENSIVLVDEVSRTDTSAVAQTTDTQAVTTEQIQRPMRGGDGGHESANLAQALPLIARNAGLMLTISAAVAVIQTVLKRRKRSRKLTMAAA